jgi:hypothetical protein
MKENIETLRGQLDRKRARIKKLEDELSEYNRKFEDASLNLDMQATVDALQNELFKERAVVVELRSIIEVDRAELIRLRSAQLAKSTNVSPSLSDKPPRYSPSPAMSFESQKMQHEYVAMILETEKSNVDKLQTELRKHLEIGSSTMYKNIYSI